MVVGDSQQETLDPRFVLLGTHQQGAPVIFEGTGAHWMIRSRVTQLHNQRRYHRAIRT
ncbi:unnamed protein product [Schistosoma margrebowiei]|uniref:Uncharacterized protein n=1 Tax=Schistosoma margrebowiei TaxID=48269 RepID=A0A183MDY7_9TREM|nr:unnamed protein product [Schistosoma margrebowiei]